MRTAADALVTALIGSRFEAWVATWPGQATRFGIHEHDGRLPDLSRDAKVTDIEADRAFVHQLEGVEFLVERTGFELPVAQAEVRRYTTVPGYNLSYLLGKVMPLRLRADEMARLGADFTLKGFHDPLLYSGSLPIWFHRRLLAGEGGGPTPAPTVAA